MAGCNGGIDLTLDEGTPLLAIASGKIISMGTGGQAEGIYLWLQHSPEDTGLRFWVYTKYQHLLEVPKHVIGEKVQVGQVIGMSGKTGTIGGHYGLWGYSHLHLTTFAGRSDQYERQGSRIIAEGALLFDPVAFYIIGLTDPSDIEHLSNARKTVTIPYVAENGSIHPSGSLVVWPVSCKSK
jgi:murein DD-endopeptidase MepM/ murein hydrolase activator NlpD